MDEVLEGECVNVRRIVISRHGPDVRGERADHPAPRRIQADGRWSERQCLRTESAAGAGRQEDVINRILAACPAFAKPVSTLRSATEDGSAGAGRSDDGIHLKFAAKLSNDLGPRHYSTGKRKVKLNFIV